MNLRHMRSRILTRLTSLLHVDVRFYGRSFAWVSMSQVSVIIRGIATTFLMGRWLPEQTFGEFRYIIAIFGVAGIFSLSGVNAAVIRGISKGDTIVAKVAFKRILLVSPLGSLVLFLAAGYRFFVHQEQTVAICLCIAAVLFPLYSIGSLYIPILTGKAEIPRLSKLSALINISFAILFCILFFQTQNLILLVCGYFIFDLIPDLFVTWREWRRLPMRGEASEHIRLGDHLSAISILQAFAHQLDQLLVQQFAGYVTLARYNIAILFPEMIKDFTGMMSGIVLQRFSKHEPTQKILHQARRHFWSGLLLAIGIIGAYVALVPFFLPLFFPQYRDQVFPSMIYAFGLFSPMAIIGLNFFQAHNQIRRLWIFYTVNTIVQIGTNLALIPFFGSWGAILSKTSTRIISVFFAYPQLDKKTAPAERTPADAPQI